MNHTRCVAPGLIVRGKDAKVATSYKLLVVHWKKRRGGWKELGMEDNLTDEEEIQCYRQIGHTARTSSMRGNSDWGKNKITESCSQHFFLSGATMIPHKLKKINQNKLTTEIPERRQGIFQRSPPVTWPTLTRSAELLKRPMRRTQLRMGSLLSSSMLWVQIGGWHCLWVAKMARFMIVKSSLSSIFDTSGSCPLKKKLELMLKRNSQHKKNKKSNN